MTNCIFCTRADQPEILFETLSLYVMPDKFPLVPGHILVISKSHLRCYAEAAPAVLRELDQAAARVRDFLREAYGALALAWENGVAGQTVFHAHLHLLPIRSEPFPAELDGHPDIVAIEDWQPVRARFARDGGYHTLEVGGRRRLIAAGSPALEGLLRWLGRAAGLRRVGEDWERETTPEDVREVNRRWAAWQE